MAMYKTHDTLFYVDATPTHFQHCNQKHPIHPKSYWFSQNDFPKMPLALAATSVDSPRPWIRFSIVC
jgi:hypothetical protein